MVDSIPLKIFINRHVLHGCKACVIGFNFAIQKIALKCNPDFSSFFNVKLVKKPVFCRYLPRGVFWTSPSHIIFCSSRALLSFCVLKYRVTMYNLIRCKGGGRVLQDINFVFSKNIDLVVLYRHAL